MRQVSNEECELVRASISPELIEAWRKDFDEDKPDQIVPVPEEVWFAGTWLKGELLALGCDPDLASGICMVLGQRQAMLRKGTNFWGPAIAILEDYKNGTWELPGPELADKLLKERFGDPLNRKEMLDWL